MNKATIYLYTALSMTGNPLKYKSNYPEQLQDKFRKALGKTPFIEALHTDFSITFIY